MSITQLPNGRWRGQIWDPATKRNVSVAKVLGLTQRTAKGKEIPITWATKREAKIAREKAREKLGTTSKGGITVEGFRERWLTDPLFARPKDSTMRHNAERTKFFAQAYGHLPLKEITDDIVAEWLRGGRRNRTVDSLRAMFNDAMSAKAGRLVARNPFSRLGIRRSPGNRYLPPPSEEQVQTMLAVAEGVLPSFAAWLTVACYSGMRPAELDALKWSAVDLKRGRIHVRQQFSAVSRVFTSPKNGQTREAPMLPPARTALHRLVREGEFCFRPLRYGEVGPPDLHFNYGSRDRLWKLVRERSGLEGFTLYRSTRHYAGWYMTEILGIDSEDVAIALGHTDGGELVRRLYGHRDKDRALDRVSAAFDRVANVVPLRAVEGA